MNKLFASIGLFVMSFLFIVTASEARAEESLLINGGFEQDVANWNLWGKELPEVVEGGHTGKSCLKVHDVEGGWTAGAWQLYKVEPGNYYVQTGWIKTDSLQSEAWMELQWFDATNTTQIGDTITSLGSKKISGTTDWTQVEIKSRAPAGASIARLAFKMEGPQGCAYFDDAKVAKQKTP